MQSAVLFCSPANGEIRKRRFAVVSISDRSFCFLTHIVCACGGRRRRAKRLRPSLPPRKTLQAIREANVQEVKSKQSKHGGRQQRTKKNEPQSFSICVCVQILTNVRIATDAHSLARVYTRTLAHTTSSHAIGCFMSNNLYFFSLFFVFVRSRTHRRQRRAAASCAQASVCTLPPNARIYTTQNTQIRSKCKRLHVCAHLPKQFIAINMHLNRENDKNDQRRRRARVRKL